MRGGAGGRGQADPREEGREGGHGYDLRGAHICRDQDRGRQEVSLPEEVGLGQIPHRRRVYYGKSTSTCLTLELLFMHSNDIHFYVGEANLVRLPHGMLEAAGADVGL